MGGTCLPLKGGYIPHPGACMFSLLFDESLDVSFVVRVETCNLCSLSGKGMDVCEKLRKRMIYVSCLQEVKWRGQGDKMLGMKRMRYKLW